MKIHRYFHNNRGSTLTEIIIVTAILGIAAELIAHNFVAQMPEYRLNRAARHISLELKEARSHAINHSTNVTVSFQNDGHEYSVWSDNNHNGNIDPGEKEEEDIHKYYPGIIIGPTGNLAFDSRGFSNEKATITLSIPSSASKAEKKVKVTLAGTVKVN